jgi:hypothetical protein
LLPAVVKEKDLLRLPADIMPVEQCAMLREILTAYRLLEDHASLKVSVQGGVGALDAGMRMDRDGSMGPQACNVKQSSAHLPPPS